MSNRKGAQSTSVGPMTLDINAALKLGWTEDMISGASKQMGELSKSFTHQVGICCIHCEAWNPRPKGGWACEPVNTVGLAELLISLAVKLGCSTQVESDARDDLIDAVRRHLK